MFDTFLDPTRVSEWLFATPGGAMERAIYEPWVGGRIDMAERRCDDLAEHFGAFVEVERPERVVFDFRYGDNPPVRVTVEFSAGGEGAEVVLSHSLPPAFADFAEQPRQGWATILAGLERTMRRGD